jgi:hypothetical protein
MGIESLRDRFKNPPREYGPTPFWGLNDDLDPDRLRFALREFADKGCAGVFMHARTGLEVPYLSEGWWDRIGVIIEECEKLGLKAWIYDEYNWPSGVAGGLALDGRPEYLMPYIEYAYLKLGGGEQLKHSGKAVAAFKVGHTVTDLSEHIEDGRFTAPSDLKGDVLLFYEDAVTDNTFATHNAPWCSGVVGYLDLMNPEAVDHYMKLTHHEYARRFRDHFGKTVPGLFTDEPQFYRGFPWTARLPGLFCEKYGYDLVERLYMLALDRGDFRRTRCHYYELVESLYAEAFYEKARRWCDDNNLIFTGHLGMEERLTQLAINHGGVYKPLKAMSLPGIDALGDGNPVVGGLVNMESPHFSPRAAACISRLYADGRVLCESSGGSGWRATPCTFKQQLDWLFASGVTFVNPHQSLLSIKGHRKRDFPPFHFTPEPWFDYYRAHSEYVSRMSMLTSESEAMMETLLYFPMSSLRSAQRGRGSQRNEDAGNLLIPFNAVMNFLIFSQRDFEFLFEEAVADGLVSVEGDRLRMGEREFQVLVMPPCRVLHSSVPDLLAEYLEAGGRMVLFDEIPRWDADGKDIIETLLPALRRAMDEGRAAQISAAVGFTREGVLAALDKLCPPTVRVDSVSTEDLILRRFQKDGADFYFVANLGEEKNLAAMTFLKPRAILERWDPVTGECERMPFPIREDGGAEIRFCLNAGESLVFAWHGDENTGSDPHVKWTNLRVLEWSGSKIKGITNESRALVETDAGTVERDGPCPPLPIILDPQWVLQPEKKNVMPVEPWQVKTRKLKPPSLAGLADEKYYTRRTRRLIKAGRPLIRAVEIIRPPENRYRTERYFEFGDTERMQRPVSRITGVDMQRWGLYETTAAMERLADYLGISTMMRSYPPLGEEYEARATVKADHVPEDLLLVYEDLGTPVSFEINGSPLAGEPQAVEAWDPACRAYPVSKFFKSGKNRIIMKSRQMDYFASPPNTHSIEPVALTGGFLVKDRCMMAPDQSPATGGDWSKRGYPSYSGPMLYKCRVNVPEEYLDYHLELEISEVRECAEVKVNGRSAGIRVYPPFTFNVTGLLKAGENELEIRVVNTGVNFFSRPRASGIGGVIRIAPYAIHEIGVNEQGRE